MNKRFSITFIQRNTEGFTPAFCEVIEGDELLEVISKFILAIARLSKKLLDDAYEKQKENDDISF